MGKRLNRPNTKKKSGNGDGNGLRFAFSSMQGYRETMEDRHLVDLSLPGHLKNWSFAGVFDGHGGKKASAFASKNILNKILPFINTAKTKVVKAVTRNAISKGIIKGFLQLDTTMRRSKRKVNDKSGTTAVGVFITPTHYIFANCGDSRAVLCSGDLRFHTKDHKPLDKEEKERIIAAGGYVSRDNRVNGRLALSRALGDFEYKQNKKKRQCRQMVIPKPDVTVLERQLTDQFIVVACDGIFDVMSNCELIEFIKQEMVKTNDLRTICNHLLNRCLALESKDNMTAIIIALPSCPSLKKIPKKRNADSTEVSQRLPRKRRRSRSA